MMAQFLIQCVVVLYGQSPTESKSLSKLIEICGSEAGLSSQIAIFVQDNSRLAQELNRNTLKAGDSMCIDYHHEPGNPGLAHAYNRALELAQQRGVPWLLLLDQDTCLTRQFVDRLMKALEAPPSENCCALVPQLVRNDLVLSPQVVGKIFYRRLPFGFNGFVDESLIAFNSAACISVQDLEAIGGFPEEFWLDYLDHMVFHRLQAAGGRVEVLDSQLEHSLSVQNLESDVSFDRYANVLAAEWMFVRETGWGGGAFVHRLRLFKRALSHLVKLRDKSYGIQALRSAFS